LEALWGAQSWADTALVENITNYLLFIDMIAENLVKFLMIFWYAWLVSKDLDLEERYCSQHGSPNVFVRGPHKLIQTYRGPDVLHYAIVTGYVIFY